LLVLLLSLVATVGPFRFFYFLLIRRLCLHFSLLLISTIKKLISKIQVTAQRSALAVLDSERDEACEAADAAAEACASAMRERDGLKHQLSETTMRAQGFDASSQELSSALAQKEAEVGEARVAGASAHKEVVQLRRVLAARMDELRTAASDLELLTRENQVCRLVLSSCLSFLSCFVFLCPAVSWKPLLFFHSFPFFLYLLDLYIYCPTRKKNHTTTHAHYHCLQLAHCF
jgi:hypothetical protein